MRSLIFAIMILLSALNVSAGNHPSLLLTRSGVEQMKASMGEVPEFDNAVKELIADADIAVERQLCVPRPVDGGGGYSHEMHKLNYYDMHNCGVAWQLTGKKIYAEKVKEILLAYTAMYPTLGYHPLGLSSVPGRIFWQTLNESVWLVHTSMAYDCIHDYLTAKERKLIETNLFRPMADFIMNGTEDNRANNEVFNKMHNHGTWATAAVGMIGMAMNDKDLTAKALYGSDKTGRNGGFIKQLDYLFSPDGYFTEGAYYQRYAIWPFVTFAQCISHNLPELDIFNYRDGIILKAVDTLLQMAYDGVFLRFNDALEKGYNAQELIYAVDIAYNADRSNKQLLSISRDYQKKVLVSDAGYAVAKGIRDGEAKPVKYKSCFLHDGPQGDNGGIALIRAPREDLNSLVTFKATSHGLSHGHFDRLTFAYYDNGEEIFTDYGASRFLNIEAKYSGHYTKLNKSYAKQTIAHNTVIVDETSHFKGKISESSKYNPEIHALETDGGKIQYASAIEENATKGVRMHRTIAYAEVPFLQYPLILDMMKVESEEKHCYDYPFHYNGHMISLNVPYTKAMDSMHALGKSEGYRHLWVEAEAKGGDGTTSYTFLTGNRMYSLSTATGPETEVYILRTGADDPDFELRSEPAIMFREKEAGNHLFTSCIETHGKYDLQVEQSANLERSCKEVRVLADNKDYAIAEYRFINGNSVIFAVSLRDNSKNAEHSVQLQDGSSLVWKGPVEVRSNHK